MFTHIKSVHKAHRTVSIVSARYSSAVAILGIETSCDDTGCAVVNGNGRILGESLYSQNNVHIRYGGVNPLIAYELHRNNIELSVNEAIELSNFKISDLDAIAVTTKPGMLINLQVGVKYAKYLARKFHKPLIPIHHMEAHALIARMYQTITCPFVVLLISGGHCLLALVKDIDNFFLLGEGLDNAPGEIMDKVARRLKLKNIAEFSLMPGGKAIETAARKASNPEQFKFPLPLTKYRDCNFSFSGLKDSVFRTLLRKETDHGIVGDAIIPEVYDLCAAFQLAIAEHIVHRTERALIFCEERNLVSRRDKTIIVSGGVACNDIIFQAIQLIGKKKGYNVYRPPSRLCTDNGVMVAWNGVEKFRKKFDISLDIDLSSVTPVAPLGKSLINEVKAAQIPVRVTRLKKYNF
ncbi:tRNA N6-adenosine threonylcarbamoyltransferase, mitochondrial-like [Achroia grisella]|uniref:tRNA N6-adenosine threonylcarbamoyltransferase, mitochondrial-like n=1 Tax=Achroia grisella TaxID=688607 RepID=UPI0027D32891|nr:tRNA N6-adenosine threonylcarbamoyltransferase, mitochondrial-like [Achroia grisella]